MIRYGDETPEQLAEMKRVDAEWVEKNRNSPAGARCRSRDCAACDKRRQEGNQR